MNLPSTRLTGPRFRLGRILVTPAALTLLQGTHVSLFELLVRHVCGDWGDLSEDDCQQNELSLEAGLRVLSSYTLPHGAKVWVITEWDRSATTVLLPDDD